MLSFDDSPGMRLQHKRGVGALEDLSEMNREIRSGAMGDEDEARESMRETMSAVRRTLSKAKSEWRELVAALGPIQFAVGNLWGTGEYRPPPPYVVEVVFRVGQLLDGAGGSLAFEGMSNFERAILHNALDAVRDSTGKTVTSESTGGKKTRVMHITVGGP